jgi:predicted outer membrane repeat protein
MKNQFQFLLISFILLFSLSSFSQSILYVNGDLDHGGNGLTWPTAYKYLQDALDYAESHSSVKDILIAGGEYLPDINSISHPNHTNNRSSSFNLRSNLAIYGGYNNVAPYNRDLNNFETVLSGNIHDPNIITDNSFHVVFAENDNDVLLDGLTIEKGYADNWENSTGAGILIRSSSIDIVNCKFSLNGAFYGGALSISGINKVINITNCNFEQNVAEVFGGAIRSGYGLIINIFYSELFKT